MMEKDFNNEISFLLSEVSACPDSEDICNLGSLNCSNTFVEKFSQSKDFWRMNCSQDDMCQIDKDDSIVIEVRLCSAPCFIFLTRFTCFSHLSVTAANS